MATNASRLIAAALRHTLADIRVEMLQQFDRNFTRQAFFNEQWQRKRRDNGKPLLTDTGTLRRSIGAKTDGNSVTFYSTEDYALIHNNGGDIRVTPRMKRYFWWRYTKAAGSMAHRLDGSLRRTRRNRQISADAEFFRAMALKRVGSKIRIPQRRFIGMHPEVEREVRAIIERNFAGILADIDIIQQ